MPHGRPSLPPPDLALSALSPMPRHTANNTHHRTAPSVSTNTMEHNVAYPFRLRHSYGTTSTAPTVPIPRPAFQPSDRPDSALSGSQYACSSILNLSSTDTDDDDYGLAGRPFAAAHLSQRSSTRLSYASSSPNLSRTYLPSSSSSSSSPGSSPASADFPIIACRPPLRPTVSFGGVSQISYYASSSLSVDQDLEARSVALAREEEDGRSLGRSASSLRSVSLRTVRNLGCVWPEARRKGRRRG